ncbi:MAG: c-type cytochrome [Candidatus Krumholzibacteriia bacterium]
MRHKVFETSRCIRLVAASAVMLLGAAASFPGAARAERDSEWLPSEPLKGRIVFEEKYCTTCHSIAGTGGDIGPDLAESYFDGGFLDLASIFWGHIPDMVVEYKRANLAWPQFTEEEVAHLISYLYYLRYLGTPGSVARGQEYLQSKGCFRCHSVGGDNGGHRGPGLDRLKKYASPIYVVQAIWNHGPKMQKMMAEMGIARPSFTGQEISDISAYIRAVSDWTMREKIYLSPGNPNDGKVVFARKRCDGCHSVHGVGGGAGPAMDDVDLSMSATDIAAIMWNHGAEMLSTMQEERIAWPTFSGKEMADLIAYLYFIKFIDPKGDAAHGRQLFGDRQCVSCHAIKGIGGEVGPDLTKRLSMRRSGIAVLTTMINHAAKMSEKVLSQGKKWPVLTGQEMRDIFAYLAASTERGAAE